MNCQSCGVPLPEDALFCTSCGVSTAVVRPPLPTWDSENQVPAMPDDLFRDPQPQAADPDQTTVRAAGWGGAPGAPVPPWRPLPAGTPEADLLPSERLEQTAFLPEPPPRKRGAGFVVLASLLTLVLVAGVVGVIVVIASTQPPRRPQQSEPPPPSVSAVSSSARPRTPSASPSASASDSASPSASSSEAFPPSGATLCTGSDSVAVGANTSCEFGANVAAGIPPGASGTFQVTANSPVTGKDYVMSCTKTTYTVCTGGNNASVYVKGA